MRGSLSHFFAAGSLSTNVGSGLISVSLCHLCVLCVSVVDLTQVKRLTTEAQRTQRTHRDFKIGHHSNVPLIDFGPSVKFISPLTVSPVTDLPRGRRAGFEVGEAFCVLVRVVVLAVNVDSQQFTPAFPDQPPNQTLQLRG